MSENRLSVLIEETVATGVTIDFDFAVADQAVLNVFWTVEDAAAVGDLSTPEVLMFTPNTPGIVGGTLLPTPLTPTVLHAAVLVGTVAAEAHQYDIRGLDRVRISITNGAAANRNVVVSGRSYWE